MMKRVLIARLCLIIGILVTLISLPYMISWGWLAGIMQVMFFIYGPNLIVLYFFLRKPSKHSKQVAGVVSILSLLLLLLLGFAFFSISERIFFAAIAILISLPLGVLSLIYALKGENEKYEEKPLGLWRGLLSTIPLIPAIFFLFFSGLHLSHRIGGTGRAGWSLPFTIFSLLVGLFFFALSLLLFARKPIALKLHKYTTWTLFYICAFLLFLVFLDSMGTPVPDFVERHLSTPVILFLPLFLLWALLVQRITKID